MKLTKETWGTYDNETIYLYKLDNGSMAVSLTNFGAIITSIMVPDQNGHTDNVVLGYDNLQGYIEDEFYAGCIVGRVAGRINHAQLTIDGQTYPLAANDGDKNIHLHGGLKGFNKQAFKVTREAATDDFGEVELYYRSAHLEEGYPGNLDLWVTYQLSAQNQLTITYKAKTDWPTHVNLTNHSYFNLSGTTDSALHHRLFVDADGFVETGGNYIPTGKIVPVQNTWHDFNTPRAIDTHWPDDFPGFNECFVLNNRPDQASAVLSETSSGRSIAVETDMPGMLVYTGDYLQEPFTKNSGLCLETQFFPDAPNQPAFPGTLLSAGNEFKSFTKFTFGW